MGERHVVLRLLSEEQHQRILMNLILPVWTGGSVAQDRPVMLFVAGQPGSGKTALADLLQESLNRRGGAVRIASDAYKILHPDYAAMLVEDERSAGIKVRPDVRRWQAEVEEHVRAQRLDAVVETALSDPDEFRASSHACRAVGQRVEVAVVAAPEALSQLGVLERGPRFVSWENHDACVRGMLATLRVIEDEYLADRVTVFRRSGEVLYSNELVDGAWTRGPAAAKAVSTEHVRPWTARETWIFRRQLAGTEDRLYGRQGSADQRLAVRIGMERAFALSEPVRRIAQPLPEPPGVDYHRLSAEEHRWIFDELIVPTYLRGIAAHDDPVTVYVVGQPGAGKTRAARLIRRALRHRRPTAIVGDDFKASHPDYLRLLEQTPRTASARIRADYQAWQEQAEAYVRARRGDMVIEMAPGSAAQLLRSANRDRAAGRRVEVVVLGVRAADSRQGTAVRYAEVSRSGLPARFTSASGHNTCFAVVPETVWAAEHGTTVHSLVVMRRDGTAAYRNERTADGCWLRPVGAVQALLGEQLRPYTEQEGRWFLARHALLWSELPQYRAELVQISQSAWPLLPERLQPRRLARSAAPAALPVRVDEAPWPTAQFESAA